MIRYTHDHHPPTCQRKHTQANTSTAEHTRYTVTFGFMLHQITGGSGAGMLPTEFTDTAAQTECLYVSKMRLMDLIHNCFCHLRISLKILLHN